MEGFRRDQWGLVVVSPVLIRRSTWARTLGNCDRCEGDLVRRLERRWPVKPSDIRIQEIAEGREP